MSKLLDFYHLKSLVRYNTRLKLTSETVAEHSYFVSLFTMIICEELNGSEYLTVPLLETEKMRIGYLKRKGAKLSHIGELYVKELKKYKENVM